MKKPPLITCLLISISLSAQHFTEVAATYGITEGYEVGQYGGGVSFCDFNNDGLDDLSFSSGEGSPVHFYLNNGHGYGNGFDYINLLPDFTCQSKQILWSDVDNDGDKDLFVTCNNDQNRLYLSDGNNPPNLTDVTSSSGLHQISDHSFGASFGDVNLDGWLDLFVANRSDIYPNFLYLNNGDGTFTDYSAESGTCQDTITSFCSGLIDINNNGLPDLYIAEDRKNGNYLYRNNADLAFSNISESSGAGIEFNAMNVGPGDYDNDGDLDIYVTNTTEGNALLRNDGNETFTDVAVDAGVSFNEISWGGTFFDSDNDGDLDLYVSAMEQNNTSPNLLYENQNNGSFSIPFPNGFDGDTLRSFGNAVGDFNDDGNMDIAVSNNITPASSLVNPFFLFQNDNTNDNYWIKIKLEGRTSNKDGVGSWIEVWSYGQKQVRYTTCGIGYLAQNANYEMVGLGNGGFIDSVVVYWPASQKVDVIHRPDLNETIKIIEQLSPLPQDLTQFELQQKNTAIQLQWALAEGFDVSAYTIERSTDGLSYEYIAKIGHSLFTEFGNGEKGYVVIDDHELLRGTTYSYRIKYHYKDRSVGYSEVQSAYFNLPETLIAYPNPATSELHLNIPPWQGAELLEIVDVQGKTVLLIDHDAYLKQCYIDIKNLSPGVYYLIYKSLDKTRVYPFTKI